MIQGEYFHREMADGLIMISSDEENPWFGKTGKECIPQFPTDNSYLLIGADRALLIDSGSELLGLRQYAENIAGVPVMFALSHGHFDHTYRLREFDEFWIHPADEKLLHKGIYTEEYDGIPEIIHYLREGDSIDLGGRVIDVYEIQGHTDGSLLYLDRNTRILISGDSITRRLLYGTGTWVPVNQFINRLREIRELEYDRILSAHDRIFLYKDQIDRMIAGFFRIPDSNQRIELFNFEVPFIQTKENDEYQLEFFDLTVPENHLQDVIEELKEVSEVVKIFSE